jgi:hypothetical protein
MLGLDVYPMRYLSDNEPFGQGLRFEVIDSASIASPLMYPFATGATGQYLPWLREEVSSNPVDWFECSGGVP